MLSGKNITSKKTQKIKNQGNQTVQRTSGSRNTIYNVLGTLIYFFCQWITTVLVVRISGYTDAGIYSMAISITNVSYVIALYGVRNFQVTDIFNKYSHSDYMYLRILTIILSIFLLIILLFFFEINTYTLECTIAYMTYKIGEAVSDLCFAYNQKTNTYRNIFISYILKGFITLALFCGVLAFSQNLLITILVISIGYYLVILLFDLPHLKVDLKDRINIAHLKQLLIVCFPLMLFAGLVPFLNFFMRYEVESTFGETQLGYFSSITMVISVLSTLMNSIFVTITPLIARLYWEKEIRRICKILAIVIAAMAGVLFVGVICVHFIGKPIFVLIFGKEIADYIYLLNPTVIASIFLALFSFFNSILIAIRRNWYVLVINLGALIIAVCTMGWMTHNMGMVGAIYSFFAAIAAGGIASLVIIMIFLYLRKTGRAQASLTSEH